MPPRRSPASARFAELTAAHGAVAEVTLRDGSTSFVCRDRGAVTHVELIDADGQTVDPLEALSRLARHRAQAEREAELLTDHAIAALARLQVAGEEINLADLARELNVARQTLYNRLEALQTTPRAAAA